MGYASGVDRQPIGRFENCSTGCRDGGHATYGECIRAKRSAVMGLESTGNDYTATRRMHNENAAYRAAVAEGLQPQAPTQAAVDKARKAADAAGQPVRTY